MVAASWRRQLQGIGWNSSSRVDGRQNVYRRPGPNQHQSGHSVAPAPVAESGHTPFAPAADIGWRRPGSDSSFGGRSHARVIGIPLFPTDRRPRLLSVAQLRYTSLMKTTTIPSIRVQPDFRAEVEAVLADGETLSQFVEASVRASVERRRVQAEFIARGLSSLDEARRTGD